MVDRLDWAIFKSIASISKGGSRRGFRNVVPKFLIFKKVLDGGKSESPVVLNPSVCLLKVVDTRGRCDS